MEALNPLSASAQIFIAANLLSKLILMLAAIVCEPVQKRMPGTVQNSSFFVQSVLTAFFKNSRDDPAKGSEIGTYTHIPWKRNKSCSQYDILSMSAREGSLGAPLKHSSRDGEHRQDQIHFGDLSSQMRHYISLPDNALFFVFYSHYSFSICFLFLDICYG